MLFFVLSSFSCRDLSPAAYTIECDKDVNFADRFGSHTVGVNHDNVVTVRIDRWVKGECGKEDHHAFWVLFQNGAYTYYPVPEKAELNTDPAELEASDKYSFYTLGAVLTVARTAAEVRMVYENDSGPNVIKIRVRCTMSGEDQIDCDPY